MSRYFVVLTGNYRNRVGKLNGDVDYNGCLSGWHTLTMDDGTDILCAGNEISEIHIKGD